MKSTNSFAGFLTMPTKTKIFGPMAPMPNLIDRFRRYCHCRKSNRMQINLDFSLIRFSLKQRRTRTVIQNEEINKGKNVENTIDEIITTLTLTRVKFDGAQTIVIAFVYIENTSSIKQLIYFRSHLFLWMRRRTT